MGARHFLHAVWSREFLEPLLPPVLLCRYNGPRRRVTPATVQVDVLKQRRWYASLCCICQPGSMKCEQDHKCLQDLDRL